MLVTLLFIVVMGMLAVTLSSCTLKIGSFGSEKTYDHQDYIIGSKKTETLTGDNDTVTEKDSLDLSIVP